MTLLDELETGPWPTFIKNLRSKNMTWNVVINSNDCDWRYVELPNDHLFGCVRSTCTHPDNDDGCCREDCCPKKVNKREYRKYEFCDAERCRFLSADRNRCLVSQAGNCPFTAKEFHHWLKDSWFEIVKKD